MKKSKKKDKQIEDLAKLIIIVIFGVSFYFTRDFSEATKITLPVIIILTVIFVSLSIVKNKKEKARLSRSGIDQIDLMDGVQFEHYLSVLFEKLGYKTNVTKATGDYGADLILKKDNEKIVVQAKRYSKNVGIKAVQEISASKSHYNADSAWVVSNSMFTKSAKELAVSNDVRLIDRNSLIDLILNVNPNALNTAKEVRSKIVPKEIHCPKCDSKMILRKSSKGSFYGCSDFPSCKGTREFT